MAINQKNHLKIIWTIVWILLAIVGFSIMYMYYKVSKDERLYFSVQGISFENTDRITIGRNSCVSYSELPKDYMTITKLSNGDYSWEISEEYKDSLAYYKVGNENPNSKKIVSGDLIDVGGKTINVGIVEEVFNQCVGKKLGILKYQSVQYVMARNIIAKELNDTSYLRRTDIKSFFYRKEPKDDLCFCILDSKCKILRADGSEEGYCYRGSVPADKCKIQFFNLTENSYMIGETPQEAFSINDLCYTVKPVLMTTEWGAGHVRIIGEGDGMKVLFPKSITMVERLDSLIVGNDNEQTECKNISIMQNFSAFPMSDVIYMPTFSSRYNMDIASLNVAADSVCLKDNCGNVTKLESKHRFIPDFDSVDLKSGNMHLICKVGLIDGSFVLSFIYLPLSVFCFFFFFFMLLMYRAKRASFPDSVVAKKQNALKVTICIFLVAFYYGLCKTLIAIKLSYTYPFFEGVAGITVLSVSLGIILAFVLYCLFSQSYLRSVDKLKKGSYRIPIPTNVLPLIFSIFVLALVALSCYFVEKGISANILDSYISIDKDWYNCKKYWSDMPGMADTYRNVPYVLFLCIIVAIIVAVLGRFILKNAFLKDALLGMKRKLDNLLKDKRKKIIVIGCVIAMVVFAYLSIWLFMSGSNYPTAFISLILVVVASFILLHTDFSNPILLVVDLFLLLGIIVLACFPDKGYITNLIGLIISIIWIVSLKIVEQNNRIDDSSTRKIPGFVFIIGILSLICVFGYIFFYDTDNNEVNYSRMDRRFDLLLKFDDVKNKGFRYTESDVEFMLIMAHYMQNTNGDDPLSNEKYWLHPSISTGQSPVILNDVSIQSSFFYAYGRVSKIVYFVLLIVLIIVVCSHVLFSSTVMLLGTRHSLVYRMTKTDIRRTLCVSMWVGTSIYLYLSYSGMIFPFTGRLNPGFGVDAVGEALESAMLIAFMMAEEYDLNY